MGMLAQGSLDLSNYVIDGGVSDFSILPVHRKKFVITAIGASEGTTTCPYCVVAHGTQFQMVPDCHHSESAALLINPFILPIMGEWKGSHFLRIHEGSHGISDDIPIQVKPKIAHIKIGTPFLDMLQNFIKS